MSIVVFGVFYAFTAFVTGYYWNVMWLDSVALFPLIALGIEKLVKEDKHLFYSITLAIVIIVNFYIAFIICSFMRIIGNSGYEAELSIDVSRLLTFSGFMSHTMAAFHTAYGIQFFVTSFFSRN